MDVTAYNQEHYGKIIREARQRKGLLQGRLAEKLGVSPNMVGHWEKGRARPDLNLVPKLCGELGITLEMFFTGKQKKSDLSREEQRLLSLFRALPEAERQSLCFSLEKVLELRSEAFREHCRKDFRRLFLNSQAAAAGTGTVLEGEAGEAVFVRAGRMSGRAREMIRVNGDSMAPTLEDGQLVYVEEAKSLHPGEIGVFVVNGTGYIKEYQGDRLHSINPAYGDIPLSEEDDIRCFGRVLGIAEEEDFPTEEELRVLTEEETQRSGDRQ